MKLNVPKGTNNVAYGGKSYAVSNGQVDVPDEVGEALMKSHSGYRRVPSDAEVKDAALKK